MYEGPLQYLQNQLQDIDRNKKESHQSNDFPKE